jgi:hypothetical protein
VDHRVFYPRYPYRQWAPIRTRCTGASNSISGCTTYNLVSYCPTPLCISEQALVLLELKYCGLA